MHDLFVAGLGFFMENGRGRGKIQFDTPMQSECSTARIVTYSNGTALPSRPMERHRLVRPRLAGIPVKRDGGSRDLDSIGALLWGLGGLQVDLHFPSATDLPRIRN